MLRAILVQADGLLAVRDAIAIEIVKVFTVQLKNAVIPAWMLESSHRESVVRVLKLGTVQ
ncbi:MAG: hypothetical protein WCK96_10745 [Methylococcales bacterium]